MKRLFTPRAAGALAALVFGLVSACSTVGEEGGSDGSELLITGGTIHLGDGAGTTVEALLVRDGRVAFAGELAGAVLAAGEDVRPLNLGGATAVPGLQDAHGHLLGLGALLEAVDLQDTRSYEEVIERIAARAAELAPGTWITGRGWDHTRWPDAEFPHHAPLSDRVPDHPVLVSRVDGHAALANARALSAAGLDGVLDPVPTVEGGRVHVDDAGRATGVLVDTAMQLVGRHVPEPDAGDLRRHLLHAQRKLLAEGLTCVHDMGLSPAELALLRELEASGELRLRVHAYLWGNGGLNAPALAPLLAERGGPCVQLSGVKLMIDGALGSRGAALLHPYHDAPDEVGLLRMEQDELEALVATCAELRLQPAIHAIGDRGNRAVLDAFERQAERDTGFLALRPRVEHAQVVAEADWPRFAAMGAIPSMQPRHATSDMRWAGERVGPERLRGAYAWRRLTADNAPLAFGSDFPVEPSAPLLGLYAARTRQDEAGQPAGGFQPEQRMSGAEALAGFTSGAAFAVREEDERGQLRPGWFADLTVLDVDPVTCEPARLLDARVLLTVIEGEVVFDGR
ncbi:MAG: amidohydrolase [Planctomycetota bacterium]